jgi:hypothetical protein
MQKTRLADMFGYSVLKMIQFEYQQFSKIQYKFLATYVVLTNINFSGKFPGICMYVCMFLLYTIWYMYVICIAHITSTKINKNYKYIIYKYKISIKSILQVCNSN